MEIDLSDVKIAIMTSSSVVEVVSSVKCIEGKSCRTWEWNRVSVNFS